MVFVKASVILNDIAQNAATYPGLCDRSARKLKLIKNEYAGRGQGSGFVFGRLTENCSLSHVAIDLFRDYSINFDNLNIVQTTIVIEKKQLENSWI